MPAIRPSQLPLWKGGDRYEMKKHQTTLKLEGEHDFSNNRKFYSLPTVGLKSTAVKPPDNLYLQGDHLNFDSSCESSPTKSKLPVFGGRPPAKRYQDNLKLDGIFYGFPNTNRDIQTELGLSPRHIQRSVMDRRSFRTPRAARNFSLYEEQGTNSPAGDLLYGRTRPAAGLPTTMENSWSRESDAFKLESKSSSIETFSDSISNSNNAGDEGAENCFTFTTSLHYCTLARYMRRRKHFHYLSPFTHLSFWFYSVFALVLSVLYPC